ncbi:FAD-dependent oxidoreductase [Limibacter armeniacum]|uniref:FAD-dependent oxidoreductase n=1 Tax=Limibacter armeniacum TaxID=466084 RepID=UPI002FE54C3A
MKYDYIIHNASITGVALAISLKRAGKAVLLINNYGFCGGSITESLNLLQETDDVQGIAEELLSSIRKQNRAVHLQEGNQVILNPEVVKSVLLYTLEDESIPYLLHVKAQAVDCSEDGVTVTLVAKEGTITKTAAQVIDASDDQYLLQLATTEKAVLTQKRIHLMVTPPQHDSFLLAPYMRTFKQVEDGRYWVSLALTPQTQLFSEMEANETNDDFAHRLRMSGARIQLLPAQTQSVMDFSKVTEASNRIMGTVSSKNAQQEFAKASEMVERLNAIAV